MIGYYIHHQGYGHLSRALAIAEALGEPVTALSSRARPPAWTGPWVTLASDETDHPVDTTANGALHWVPLGHEGLRRRMATIAAWLDDAAPAAMIVDVSAEVAALARLHGVPVVTVAQAGVRTDPAHDLGYRLSSAVVGAWPASAAGIHSSVADVQAVGAISRYRPAAAPPPAHADPHRRVLVLDGSGGDAISADAVARASADTRGWDWRHLGGASATWSDDPWAEIRWADVVVTHAGQNALAEVAAARVPAVVIPRDRPFGEQRATARVLAAGAWPAVVRRSFPLVGWPDLLQQASELDGAAWADWNDGGGAARAATVVRSVAIARPVPAPA